MFSKRFFVDGWYNPNPACDIDEVLELSERVQKARKPWEQIIEATEAVRLSQIARKIAESLDGHNKVITSKAAADRFLRFREILERLLSLKNNPFRMPENVRYYLPYDGAVVYLVTEEGIIRRIFNIYDNDLTNILALGRTIFMTKEEAIAAFEKMKRNKDGSIKEIDKFKTYRMAVQCSYAQYECAEECDE